MSDNTFCEYVVHDLLCYISNITSRAMFGGYSLYKNGKVFAIIADGELYFKGRKETENFYNSQLSRKFTYNKKDGKVYTMNYWLVPEKVYENRDRLMEWLDVALD